jgi:GDP-L-fucose synthase
MQLPLETSASIFVTGHRGLVGSALVRKLRERGFTHILTATREELELRDQKAVSAWFAEHHPEYVIHAAGTVGGILANATRPAEFLYDNLMLHATVLRAAWEAGTDRLLYLGSSCVYPRDCPQPIKEEYLLTGQLEKTNDAYAIAKLSGIVACQAYRRQYGCRFITAMPSNVYGPNDSFDLLDAHVLPALLHKFHTAKHSGEREVVIWGTGTPRREFLHVDDLAEACLHLLAHYDDDAPINVGTGVDLTIAELAEQIRDVVYPEAEFYFDTAKPDGTPRKLLDISKLNALGWRHRIELHQGLIETYEWYQQHVI